MFFFCEFVVVVTSFSTVLNNTQIPGLLPYRSICIPELKKTSLSLLSAAIQFIILKATDDI